MKKIKLKKLVLPAVVIIVLAILWGLSLRHLDFASIQKMTLQLQSTAQSHQVVAFLTLMLIQATGMFFTLPTKALFNMVGCALLGLLPGLLLTLAGTLAGTTGLFFTTQKIARTDTRTRLPELLMRFEQRLQTRPILTVASLRMILALPYGGITIFCAISQIPYRAFLTGSVIGDIPVLTLYSMAGLKLGQLASKSEAVSLQTIALLSIAGAGLFAGSLWRPSKKADS